MSISEPATVRISIPADARFTRSVRLAVGGLAALADFDIEAIEDLRIGVDELCGSLIACGNGSDLDIDVHLRPRDLIRIDGRTVKGSDEVDDERFSFSRQILSVVADEYSMGSIDGHVFCWIERSAVVEVEPDLR